MKNKIFEALTAEATRLGSFKSNIILTKDIETDRSFRAMCEANSCGVYGKCYMCPPYVGDIDELMSRIKNYDYALVHQTVSTLEDSFDFEGMINAKKSFYATAQKLREVFGNLGISHTLHLGAGGCGVCPVCAKRTDEPCRFPSLAMPSLEAYGINVSQLAKSADMNYINGKDTVTYFGAVLFSLK